MPRGIEWAGLRCSKVSELGQAWADSPGGPEVSIACAFALLLLKQYRASQGVKPEQFHVGVYTRILIISSFKGSLMFM